MVELRTYAGEKESPPFSKDELQAKALLGTYGFLLRAWRAERSFAGQLTKAGASTISRFVNEHWMKMLYRPIEAANAIDDPKYQNSPSLDILQAVLRHLTYGDALTHEDDFFVLDGKGKARIGHHLGEEERLAEGRAGEFLTWSMKTFRVPRDFFDEKCFPRPLQKITFIDIEPGSRENLALLMGDNAGRALYRDICGLALYELASMRVEENFWDYSSLESQGKWHKILALRWAVCLVTPTGEPPSYYQFLRPLEVFEPGTNLYEAAGGGKGTLALPSPGFLQELRPLSSQGHALRSSPCEARLAKLKTPPPG